MAGAASEGCWCKGVLEHYSDQLGGDHHGAQPQDRQVCGFGPGRACFGGVREISRHPLHDVQGPGRAHHEDDGYGEEEGAAIAR